MLGRPIVYLWLPLLFAITSCSGTMSSRDGLASRLVGRGPVALSPDNPYLVGNLILAREAARSPSLRGFLEHRGTPGAIEVQGSTFSSYQLFLLYSHSMKSNSGELYVFEQAGSDWIIDGPKPLSPDQDRKLQGIRNSNSNQARLLRGDDLIAALGDSVSPMPPPSTARELDALPAVQENLDAIPSLPPGTPPPQASFTSPLPPASSTTPILPLKSSESQIAEQELAALINSGKSHPAEISPKGDLVHYVTFSDESLPMIARWYTLDPRNTGRLARINGLKDAATLSIGDIVVVPAYLVRNKNRFSREALEILKKVR
jgi:hypothetical protein